MLDFLKELDLVKEVPERIEGRIGLERQVRILLQHEHLETVAVYRQGDAERIAIPQEWPALTLSDADWRNRVAEAAGWADLIVLYWGADTPGLDDELQICAAPENRLKTVLVMPSTPTEIYLSQVVKTFPRVVPRTEIPPLIALHPEFTPLIERMKAIQALAPKVRSRKKFPWPPTSGRFAGETRD